MRISDTRNALVQSKRIHLEIMALTRSPLLCDSSLNIQVYGLSTSSHGCDCRSHHWGSSSLVCVQTILPCKSSPSYPLQDLPVIPGDQTDNQPLEHPQAYKPYSPRIAKEEEIPLHNRQSSQINGRPSMDTPNTALLSSQLATTKTTQSEGYGYNAYPPSDQSGHTNVVGHGHLGLNAPVIGQDGLAVHGHRQEVETVRR